MSKGRRHERRNSANFVIQLANKYITTAPEVAWYFLLSGGDRAVTEACCLLRQNGCPHDRVKDLLMADADGILEIARRWRDAGYTDSEVVELTAASLSALDVLWRGVTA